jgi:hypothetical protein
LIELPLMAKYRSIAQECFAVINLLR